MALAPQWANAQDQPGSVYFYIRFMMSRTFRTFLAFVGLMCLRCDELLPPRDEPQRFLQGGLSFEPGIVVVTCFHQFETIIVRNANGASKLVLRNLYDDVLQGEPRILGSINIWLKDKPTEMSLVQLDRSNITNFYLPPGGLLTLRPGDTVALSKQWSHNTLAGKPCFQFASLAVRFDDSGELYWESSPVDFIAKGALQVFQDVQAEQMEQIEFSLVYHIYPVEPPDNASRGD